MDHKALSNHAASAAFLARWVLGIIFLMAGYGKVFGMGNMPDMSVMEHARLYFVDNFTDHWIPEWLLWALGVVIPWVELAAGILLLIGIRIRDTLVVLGCLLIVTTYGHALKAPLFDIDGHTFTRLALIIFLLVHGWSADRWTLEAWFKRGRVTS